MQVTSTTLEKSINKKSRLQGQGILFNPKYLPKIKHTNPNSIPTHWTLINRRLFNLYGSPIDVTNNGCTNILSTQQPYNNNKLIAIV